MKRWKKKLTVAAVAASTVVAGIVAVNEPGPRFYEIPATQDINYQVMPTELAPRWGSAHPWPDERAGLRERLREHQGASYVVKPRARPEWSRARNLSNTLAVLSDRVTGAPVGQVWLVRALLDDYTERARKVDLNPAVAMDTEGTVAVDIIAGTTFSRFPELRNSGIYNCRNIAGSGSWSQHAYSGIGWRGNAIDFGGETAMLAKAARYQYDLVRKGYLPASQILWWGHNLLSGSTVYDHYDHVHTSGLPLFTGTPLCAR